MASSSKRQTTMAKLAREQAVREKRARKLEKKEDKKQAAADALTAEAEGALVGEDDDADADAIDADAPVDADAPAD
jgi:Tfp pilus assembly protein FimT